MMTCHENPMQMSALGYFGFTVVRAIWPQSIDDCKKKCIHDIRLDLFVLSNKQFS